MSTSTKIEITLGEIILALKALNELSKKEGLPFKLNYRIARVSQIIEPLVESYRKAMTLYFQENGEFNEDTKQHEIKADDKERISEFNKLNLDLTSEKHSLEVTKADIELFLESDIQAEIIRPLLWMIEGDI